MAQSLHWHTVTPILKAGLTKLMSVPMFSPFRLVGGTSLSLQLGHRASVDIDLFTDATYNSVNFYAIDTALKNIFPYVYPPRLPKTIGMGLSYIVGNTSHDSFKLDMYYTDSFIYDMLQVENIRMASIKEVAAMKIDVVQRMGRKKDFWDIHELCDTYTIEDMISFHQARYPYTHERETILKNLIDFSAADNDFDPICLRGKKWELIKLDMINRMSGIC